MFFPQHFLHRHHLITLAPSLHPGDTSKLRAAKEIHAVLDDYSSSTTSEAGPVPFCIIRVPEEGARARAWLIYDDKLVIQENNELFFVRKESEKGIENAFEKTTKIRRIP